jgi:hypothetical protein
MTYTEKDIAVLDKWEKELEARGIVFSRQHPGSFNIVMGYIQNKLGGVISEDNLNRAVIACWQALVFEPGREMTDPHAAEKAKAAADKAAAEAELEKKRREQAARDRNSWLTMKPSVPDHGVTEDTGPSVQDTIAEHARRHDAAMAQREAERVAETYTAMHQTGRVDHAKTQRGREGLAGVFVKVGGKVDWALTLKARREAIGKMPQ